MIIDYFRTTRLGFFRLPIFLFVVFLFLSGCSNESEDFMMGKYKANTRSYYLAFFEDGSFKFGTDKYKSSIQGQYRIEDQTITFHSETMIDSGKPTGCGEGEGSYTWFLKDKVLVMSLEDDNCVQRKRETNEWEYVLIE